MTYSVIGGGIAGLTAARDLAHRGYGVMGENLIRWSTCSQARIGRVHQASRSLGRSDMPNGR